MEYNENNVWQRVVVTGVEQTDDNVKVQILIDDKSRYISWPNNLMDWCGMHTS